MKKIYLLAAGLLMLTSCSLDINDNPNYPSGNEVTPDLMFPSVENAIADVTGDQMFNYAGFFAQYFEQMPEANQYNNLAELNLDEQSDLFNRCYSTLYAGALQDIKDLLTRTKNTSDVFMCSVMRAQAYQLLVDNIDEAPYKDALGAGKVPMPKWDKGKEVYEGVLKEMDDAQKALNGEASTLKDPMLHSDLSQWVGYANALRLRMYLRLIDGNVDVAAYTQKVKDLVKENKFFTGDVVWDVYSNAEGQYNPWYASKFKLGTSNHCAAMPIVSYFIATSDPRVGYAWNKNGKGEYVGQIPGSKTTMKEWSGKDWKNAQVSTLDYNLSKAMPIYLFTQSELQFLKAEVELRFNNDEAAAKRDYEAGVLADFESRGVEGADGFLTGNKVAFDLQTSKDSKLNLIYMQKWVALFYRDHMEAWSEARRTDVPKLSSMTAREVYEKPTDYVAGEFIVPAVDHIQAGGLAKRVPYPSNARKLNTNTPPIKLLSDRVFWDVK